MPRINSYELVPGDSLGPVGNAGVHQRSHRVRIHSVRRETLGQQHLEWLF